nr:hypothetical protein Itr_chr12CG27140 [Ipomoea trifida]
MLLSKAFDSKDPFDHPNSPLLKLPWSSFCEERNHRAHHAQALELLNSPLRATRVHPTKESSKIVLTSFSERARFARMQAASDLSPSVD